MLMNSPSTAWTAPAVPSATGSARLAAAAASLAACAVLGLAAWLAPDPGGVGTHRQLGLAACTLYEATGLPCATCGMTTAFAHAADGHQLAAFIVQPAGALLALATAVVAIVAGYAAATGTCLTALIHAVARPLTFWALVALILLGWGYKVLVIVDPF
jgi:hypothetical protein